MELKIMGHHARVELVVLFLVIGMVLGGHIFCSCTSFSMNGMPSDVGSVIKEAFTQQLGSDDYSATNRNGGWVNAAQNYAQHVGNQNNAKSGEYHKGGPIPLPPGELLIFAENEIKPECCPSYYASSNGCVCASKKQLDYLNQRGGNRTYGSDF
jgi:hypothetical protein